MELDRQGIERRDFPIVRRGYDPATVDAHLRALSAEVEELRREAEHSGHESLATVAGTQVQGILEAAQATAQTIESEAAQDAQRVRAAADADARRTRDEAIARAQAHVAAVSKATEALLGRVGSLDGETRALVESLRSGAGRLAGDLGAVEAEMEALYDAAAGRVGESEGAANGESRPEHVGQNGVEHAPMTAAPMTVVPLHSEAEPSLESQTVEQWPGPALPGQDQAEPPPESGGDLDGARLVALNMALNGDSREHTGRYLEENFEIAEPERLLDEVYAAIEG